MLRHAHENPHLPPPFRAAIFQNGAMPWSATPDLGKDVTPLVIQHRYVPCTLAEADRALADEHAKNPTQASTMADERKIKWEDSELIPPMMRVTYHKIVALDAEKDVKREYDDFRSRRMFPEVDKVRVGVPSAHILGKKDWQFELGAMMGGFCDPEVRLMYKHGFGHEIPARSPRDIWMIKEVIEKTVIRADFA